MLQSLPITPTSITDNVTRRREHDQRARYLYPVEIIQFSSPSDVIIRFFAAERARSINSMSDSCDLATKRENNAAPFDSRHCGAFNPRVRE